MNKIYIPAVVVQTVWCVILMLHNGVDAVYPDDKLYMVFLDVLCLNPHNNLDGTMWFLSYLFFCYMSFYVFMRIKDEKKALLLLTVYWIIFVPAMCKVWHNVPLYTLAFPLGVIIACFSKSNRVKLGTAKLFLVTTVLMIVLGIYLKFFYNYSSAINIIAGILSSALFMTVIKLIGADKFKILGCIGNCSFFIFLLEYKVIFALIDYGRFSDGARELVYLILVILTFVFSYCISKVLSRNIYGIFKRKN